VATLLNSETSGRGPRESSLLFLTSRCPGGHCDERGLPARQSSTLPVLSGAPPSALENLRETLSHVCCAWRSGPARLRQRAVPGSFGRGDPSGVSRRFLVSKSTIGHAASTAAFVVLVVVFRVGFSRFLPRSHLHRMLFSRHKLSLPFHDFFLIIGVFFLGEGGCIARFSLSSY
jgi:hypothetical protein